MSVYPARSGRGWVAQISRHHKNFHLGTFATEAEARAAEAAVKRPPPRRPLERFVVEDRGYSTPCWIWEGAKQRSGYGRLWDPAGRRYWMAHRYFYAQHIGPIPDGLQLDHLCRVKGCVNPDHLEPVTQPENMRRGALARLTHDDVAAIRASSETHSALAERYGVSEDWIWKIRTERGWRPDPVRLNCEQETP